jgi:alpha-tubulin suppressor-like RCC1 family protein
MSQPHPPRPRRLIRAALILGLATASAAACATAFPALAQAKTLPTQSQGVSWGANASGQLGDGSPYSNWVYTNISGLTGVRQISAGQNYGLAAMTSGQVYAWGDDSSGQLGTAASSTTPQLVPGLTNMTQVAAGWSHSLALRSDGTVWAWGDNSYGQLGVGYTSQKLSPVQVQGLTNVTKIAVGNTWSLALRSDGTVWAWGGNQYEQLGPAVGSYTATPVQVPGLSQVSSIAAGAFFALALETHGYVAFRNYVYAWGQNVLGTLGNGTACPFCGIATPEPVNGINVPEVASIAAGPEMAMAVGTDGTVWDWGSNSFGDLGINNTTLSIEATPVNVAGLTSVTQVAAGAYHAVALLSNGTVQAWGNDQNGQLGDDDAKLDSPVPVTVTGLSAATQVAAGGNTSMAVHTVLVFRQL